jgi:hypothetical protein
MLSDGFIISSIFFFLDRLEEKTPASYFSSFSLMQELESQKRGVLSSEGESTDEIDLDQLAETLFPAGPLQAN